MKKIRFIINPNSGTRNKKHYPDWINNNIDHTVYSTDIVYTERRKHATELAADAAKSGYDVVVAVGGDGSANEVASGLVHTATALGIIPTGSGNGMARHLKLPLDFKKAVKLLNKGTIEKIDTVRVNEHFCLGTAGFGFDAYIAHLFDKAGKRGYSTYVKLVLTEFSHYPLKHFSILADEKLIRKDCFLFTVANSSQFGNNAVIAPFADVKDGMLEISMMSKFPLYAAPSLIFRLINNSIHLSKFFTGIRARSIVIENDFELQGHIDGEPITYTGNVNITTDQLSLKVLTGK